MLNYKGRASDALISDAHRRSSLKVSAGGTRLSADFGTLRLSDHSVSFDEAPPRPVSPSVSVTDRRRRKTVQIVEELTAPAASPITITPKTTRNKSSVRRPEAIQEEADLSTEANKENEIANENLNLSHPKFSSTPNIPVKQAADDVVKTLTPQTPVNVDLSQAILDRLDKIEEKINKVNEKVDNLTYSLAQAQLQAHIVQFNHFDVIEKALCELLDRNRANHNF